MGKRFFDTIHLDAKSISYTPEGYMIVPANLARSGVQDYPAAEGGKLWRKPTEVFRPDSIGTLRGKSISVLHPVNELGKNVLINPDNWKQYEIGHILEPKQNGNFLFSDLMIKDAAAIAEIEQRIVDKLPLELSCGYIADTVSEAGETPEGEKYDGYMQDIIYNHVAIVPQGRAGKEVRMLIDHFVDINNKTEKKMTKVMFNDVTLDVSDESVKALNDIFKAHTETQAKLDAANAQIKTLETQNATLLDASEVEVKAAELSELRILCDGMKLDHKDKKLDEMKNAIVGAVLPDAKEKFVSGDPIYRTAMFDAALPMARKAVENNRAVLDGLKSDAPEKKEDNSDLFEVA